MNGLAASGQQDDPRSSVITNQFAGPHADSDAEPGLATEPDTEVDLKSWGLGGLLSEDERVKTKSKKQNFAAEGRGIVHQRSLSIPLPAQADQDDVQSALERAKGISPQIESATLPVAGPRARGGRRMSVGDVLDMQASTVDPKSRPASMFAALTDFEPPVRRSSDGQLAFPSDTDSPFAVPLSRPTSRFDPKFMRTRAISNETLGSQLVDKPYQVPELQPPGRDRTLSNATLGTLGRPAGPYEIPLEGDEDGATNPYSVPIPRGSSYGDAGPRMRTMSGASFGSRMVRDYEGDDAAQPPAKEGPRYSRADLMRPKLLVMPGPLQGQHSAPAVPGVTKDGFLLSTDGPPLPAGARGRPTEAQDSLIFNPRQSLTLAQLTFRNSLMVGGKRDVAFTDIESSIPRAAEEGEQVDLNIPEESELGVLPQSDLRPPGKYYGEWFPADVEPSLTGLQVARSWMTWRRAKLK